MNVVDAVTNVKFFPTLIIIISACAASSYVINGIAHGDFSDWRKIGYWCASSVLTYCVTY